MIHFDVNMDDLVEIEAALGMVKDKSKHVLRTAINNTAKQTVNLLVDEAKAQYLINKPTGVRKTMTLDKATIGRLYAVVRSNGKTSELYDFSVKPRAYTPKARPAGGHKGNVVRLNAAGQLEFGSITKSGRFTNPRDPHKAFVVMYSSGHVSVAQRVPGTKRGTPRADHPEGEEAIKNLRAVSIPKMLGNEQTVFGIVKPKVYDLLQKNIQAQINRYLV